MKKQIISVLLLISLSFQSTYPVFEGLKEKASRLYGKYGKARVNKTVAMIKKYNPKGLITRFKEARKERKAAGKALYFCMFNKCRKVRRNWGVLKYDSERWIEEFTAPEYSKEWINVHTYNSCKSLHCLNEYNRFNAAWNREGELSVGLGIALLLGSITTTMLVAAGVSINVFRNVKRELHEEEEKRIQERIGKHLDIRGLRNPLYEE